MVQDTSNLQRKQVILRNEVSQKMSDLATQRTSANEESMVLANTHHCHVVQHATIHSSFIKLGLVLRQTNVIQPSCEDETKTIEEYTLDKNE